MSRKLYRVKRISRLLVIRVSLALLLTFATFLGGSVGSASNIRLKSESVVMGELEPRVEESREPLVASGPDSDVLVMEGDWIIRFGSLPSLTYDSDGHYMPEGYLWILPVHLINTGPGAHGGHKFEGYYRTFPWLGRFYGETFYDGWGVQLVQMRYEEEDRGSGRYYKLLSGKHQLYTRDPTRVEVLGGWVDVGGLGGASGYYGSFVMVKE